MGHHLTSELKFKSDKYEWCPEGFFALKFTDKNAQKAILEYVDLVCRTDPCLAFDLMAAVEAVRREQAAAAVDTVKVS